MKLRMTAFWKIYLVLLFCIGCQNQAPTFVPTLTTTSPTATSTLVPTTSPTPIPSATPTKIVLPSDSVIQSQCPEISKQSEVGFARGALVVLHRDLFSEPAKYVYLDLTTNTKAPLSKTTLASGGDVSPSRNRIVYQGMNAQDMHTFLVIDTVGEIQSAIANPNIGFKILRWLDDQHIIIRVYKNLQGPPPIDPPPHEIALLNPFTGETQILSPDFPDISPNDVDWNYLGPGFYNKSLEEVLYAAWNVSANSHEYVLYHIPSKTSLAKLPGSAYGGFIRSTSLIPIDGVTANPPAWSPNDTRVALISPAPEKQGSVDEIFAIGKEGIVQRLTYFANHFEKAKISQLSWSPDNKSIAFWVSLSPAPYEISTHAVQDERLAIVNTETLTITVYCISGNEMGIRNIGSGGQFVNDLIPAPIWSPDGSQVLVENRYDSDFSRLIILDISRNKSVEVGQNLEPLGWMIGIP